MLHRLEPARPLSTKLDLKGLILPSARAAGAFVPTPMVEVDGVKVPDEPVRILDITPRPMERFGSPSDPSVTPEALVGAARASLIAHAQTLLEVELKRRASEAFFSRNMQLAEVLRDLSDELPEKLATQLKELS